VPIFKLEVDIFTISNFKFQKIPLFYLSVRPNLVRGIVIPIGIAIPLRRGILIPLKNERNSYFNGNGLQFLEKTLLFFIFFQFFFLKKKNEKMEP